VPAVMVSVPDFEPKESPAGGANRPSMTQLAPGARLVVATSWPPTAGPQVENKGTTLNSVALPAAIVACVMPVRVTFPVLVSVNCVTGQARPQPPDAVGDHETGVRAAAATTGTPFPERLTGELATVKPPFVVMVAVPVYGLPLAVGGVNTTLMVHVAPFAKVAAQVPPAVPAGLVNAPAEMTMARLRVDPVWLLTVRVWAPLVLPAPMAPKASDAGLTAIFTPVPLKATGVPVPTAPVKATARVRVKFPVAVGANTTLYVQEAPTANVAPQVPGLRSGRLNGVPVPVPVVLKV